MQSIEAISPRYIKTISSAPNRQHSFELALVSRANTHFAAKLSGSISLSVAKILSALRCLDGEAGAMRHRRTKMIIEARLEAESRTSR